MKLRIYSSASIAANSLLYVRPSSWCFELRVCVHRSRVCPGSVGTRQALLQGWLCVSPLCALQMCLLVRRPFFNKVVFSADYVTVIHKENVKKKPLYKVLKENQIREAHIKGMGDVLFKGFQCLRSSCKTSCLSEKMKLMRNLKLNALFVSLNSNLVRKQSFMTIN